MQGRIVKGVGGFYYVKTKEGSVYTCHAKGVFRNRDITPLIGDYVSFQVTDEAEKEGTVEDILPRTNEISRPASSNVDQALLLFSMKKPNPNLNLIDRFLLTMHRQKIAVCLCFNKTDLVSEKECEELRTIYENSDCRIFFFSVRNQTGLSDLSKELQHRTTVLAGPSGVGKSSLINWLIPGSNIPIGEISERIGRGKQTTRHTEIFSADEDTFLLDTPGFGSVFLPDCGPEEIKDDYPEFVPYEQYCRFPGCVHMEEPGCGVRDAVKEGLIPKSRYDNYRLFYEEQKEKRRYTHV